MSFAVPAERLYLLTLAVAARITSNHADRRLRVTSQAVDTTGTSGLCRAWCARIKAPYRVALPIALAVW